jgi:hypothetical protein
MIKDHRHRIGASSLDILYEDAMDKIKKSTVPKGLQIPSGT